MPVTCRTFSVSDKKYTTETKRNILSKNFDITAAGLPVPFVEGRILLSGSSHSESSVKMRVRLEGRKKPL